MAYIVLQPAHTLMNTPSAGTGLASVLPEFTYRELALRWDEAACAWVSALPALGPQARLHLEMCRARAEPSVLACEVALATLVLLDRLDHDARRYLVFEAGEQAGTLGAGVWDAAALQAVCLALPGDVTSDRFALCYRVHESHPWLWTVRFRGLMPLHWRVERLPEPVGPAAATRGSWMARLREAVRPVRGGAWQEPSRRPS